MNVTVRAFAQAREVLGSSVPLQLPEDARVADIWASLPATVAYLRASTRVARNGAIASEDERLCDGDELALLPPVGGG